MGGRTEETGSGAGGTQAAPATSSWEAAPGSWPGATPPSPALTQQEETRLAHHCGSVSRTLCGNAEASRDPEPLSQACQGGSSPPSTGAAPGVRVTRPLSHSLKVGGHMLEGKAGCITHLCGNDTFHSSSSDIKHRLVHGVPGEHIADIRHSGFSLQGTQRQAGGERW